MKEFKRVLTFVLICGMVFCNGTYFAYADGEADGDFRIRENVNVNECYYGKLVADGRDLIIGDSPGSNARYAFHAPANGVVNVEVEILPEEGTDRYLSGVYLEDENGNELTGEYQYDEIETEDGTIHYMYSLERTRVSTEKCYLVLENNVKLNGHSVAYWFKIGFTDESGDTNVEKEFNNSRATANPINLDEWYSGNSNYKDYDYFRFEVWDNQKIKINLKCAEYADNYLDIVNENGDVIVSSEYKKFESSIIEDMNGDRWNQQWKTYTFAPGTYYVRILGDNLYDEYGAGVTDRWKNHQDYYFNLEKLRAQVKIDVPQSFRVSKTKKKSVTLNWSKVKNADGYKIYRAASKNGKYKVVKTFYHSDTQGWSNKN